MRVVLCVVMVLACVPAAWGQAITGFTGGSEYDSYYGSVAGDVIGWRFTVSAPMVVTNLGVWNGDQTGGVESPHQVGIWDSSQTLLTSGTVDGTGTVAGDFIYTAVAAATLSPGETYTIGALYVTADNDYYISSASSITTAPEVTFGGAVFPSAGELGFVYPTEDSGPTSYGRFGPNFFFADVPVEMMTFTVD